MTRRKEREELIDDAGRLVPAREVRSHLSKAEEFALLPLFDDVGVRDPADRALAVLHLVAGERARLVGEDVLDLAELFDETGSAAEGGSVGRSVVHVCEKHVRWAVERERGEGAHRGPS